MPFSARLRCCGAALVVSVLLGAPAHGLVRWNEGKDQVFVNLGVNAAWDSNIFTANGGEGDIIYSGNLSLDYQRRAGLIGVNFNVGFDVGRFDTFSDEDFLNPNYRLELTKDSGRTTGSTSLSLRRESKADADVNVRTDAWIYQTQLDLKYPIIERYSVTAGFGYGERNYDSNVIGLVDLATYSFNSDLFYIFTTERDLIAGYRLRINETSALTETFDHSFTAGVSGKILSKLNGTIRSGYQFSYGNGPGATSTEGFTLAASLSWAISRTSSLSGQLSRDLTITSTNINVESTNGSLTYQRSINTKLSLSADVGGGQNRFLGVFGNGRVDTFFSGGVNLNYALTPKIRSGLSYTYYENWSTEPAADFDRHSVNFSLATRL